MVMVRGLTVSNAHAEEVRVPVQPISAQKVEEPTVTGNASLGIFNQYIFRGYKLSSGSVVIQSSKLVFLNGFSAAVWGNVSDIASHLATYFNLLFSYSLTLYREITPHLGASFGHFSGRPEYWRTFEESTGANTGKKYRAFHEGMLKADVTLSIAKNAPVQPVIQWSFPLSADGNRVISGHFFHPIGNIVNSTVYGLKQTLNFQ